MVGFLVIRMVWWVWCMFWSCFVVRWVVFWWGRVWVWWVGVVCCGLSMSVFMLVLSAFGVGQYRRVGVRMWWWFGVGCGFILGCGLCCL